jgi:hypothetical protein
VAKNTWDRIYYTNLIKIVVLFRLLFGPTIFLFPRFTAIVSLILDWADGEFYKRAGYDHDQYAIYDKVLDYYWYIWILLYIVLTDAPYKPVFIFLFFYRTLGQLLYFLFKKEILFFIFFNAFEIFFFYYLAVSVNGNVTSLLSPAAVAVALVVIIISVLIREWVLHIAKMNLSNTFTGKKTFWLKQGINPYKVFLFFSLVLSFGFVLNQYVSRQTTETYVTQAQRAQKDGVLVSYQTSGTLTGMLFAYTDATEMTILKVQPSGVQTVCYANHVPILKSPIAQKGSRSDVYVFSYTDPCLGNLPDGGYRMVFSHKERATGEKFIEFGIYRGKLQR